MTHYKGYTKFRAEGKNQYEFNGLTIINTTNDSFHIFVKKEETEEVIDADFVSSTCASDTEGEMIEIDINLPISSEEA